jgi:hypothetical protein
MFVLTMMLSRYGVKSLKVNFKDDYFFENQFKSISLSGFESVGDCGGWQAQILSL